MTEREPTGLRRHEFVDFDTAAPDAFDAESLDGFVVTVGPDTNASALAMMFTRLAPDGIGRLRLSKGAPSATALVGGLPEGWRDRTWRSSGHTVELVVRAGSGVAVDDAADAFGVALEIVASLQPLPARVDGLEKRLARIERESRQRAERVRDTTQFRLGAAMIELVRSPRQALAVFRELRAIWKRRSEPPARRLPDVAADPRLGVKVGSILDEFSHECFAPEVALRPLTRNDGMAELAALDLILVESAWRGNAGHWSYALNRFDDQGAPLRSLLDQAAQVGVPTVFWNKEDPVGFDLFLPAARSFDHVFTTDANMLSNYRTDLGHDRVGIMAFAAQPTLHNPIGRPRADGVTPRLCFAGSWRGDKYDARRRDFETLLLVPLQRGVLDIYDRYADGNESDQFPEPYRSAVVGRLPYRELSEAYRRFAAFLNVNSVSDSPSMFSRRVFELLACGTPVISTPAQGIEEMLGDTVLITESASQTEQFVDWVINEPDERDLHAHRGYRLVHTEHTYEQRVDDLLAQVGRARPSPRRRVSVVCASNRPQLLPAVIAHYNTQTYADKELVFVANSSDFTDEHLARLDAEVDYCRILRVDESASLGQCLNEALRVADGEYFAKFDDDDLYGAEYLADLMLAFRYSDAAVVGKQSYFAYLEGADETVIRFPGREFCDAPRVVGGTLVVDRSQIGGIEFAEIHGPGTDSRFIEAVREAGSAIFSADRYNFCQVRRVDPASHTWKINDTDFLKACRRLGAGRRDDQIFV